MPVLLLFFRLTPAQTAGTSLALVVANSAAGSLGYYAQKLIDFRIALLISVPGVFGSILGAVASRHVAPGVFDMAFAALLIGLAADLVLRRRKQRAAQPAAERAQMAWHLPVLLGFAVGFAGSLFGIGGGVIVVPALLYLSGLAPARVSATSTFSILLTAPVGLIAHWYQRDVDWLYVLPLVLAGVAGGLLGSRIAPRLKQSGLVVLVALAMTLAALALVLRHFTHA